MNMTNMNTDTPTVPFGKEPVLSLPKEGLRGIEGSDQPESTKFWTTTIPPNLPFQREGLIVPS